VQFTPPGTPFPQEIAGGSTAASAPAKAGTAIAPASKHTWAIDQRRFIASILTCHPLFEECY
jgi:hypothetical protein